MRLYDNNKQLKFTWHGHLSVGVMPVRTFRK